MNKTIDYPLYLGLVLAHILLFSTFYFDEYFWYIFPASMTILITLSIQFEKLFNKKFTLLDFLVGFGSGLLLYAIFWIGKLLFSFLPLDFLQAVTTLYDQLSPTQLWHYVVLTIIIIPGEEIFWRGFVQGRLLKHTHPLISIVVATFLYTVPHLYSGSYLLVLAAIVGGIFWSTLYFWWRSMPLVIVSHLVFDLFLLVLLPLN